MPAKPIPISKTKIIVPNRRPELLSRPRLLESIKPLLDNKLILLSAPAGYGKTSLLIDLANSVDMPICWLSLDPLDRDPQRFIAYLIASLSERFPDIGATSRIQLNQLRSIDKDSEELLVTLTNEIYDQIEDDFLLILDDYHLLDDVPTISVFVNRFLELVVENCHVILSSRTLPSLDDVTIMVAREQVAGLSHEELVFLPREVQALYSQNYRQHLSDETAQRFVDETGGWITGMLLSNLPGMPRVSGVDAFAYLGNQVLDQQPYHLREFLIRSSLPQEFNAEFCETVLGPFHSGPQNWHALMSTILERNLFVLPLESDGRWLRYHPLFREFLQTRLKDERPNEVRPILERMVTAYEKSGEWEKAYFTCKQLDDVDALAGVVEGAGTHMLLNAFVTLEGWVNSLPPSMVQTRPGLVSLRGSILAVKGNLAESKELLDKAIAIHRKNHNKSGLILSLIRRANTLRFMGDYKASLNDLKEVLCLAESDVSHQSYYAEALRIKGLNLYRLGESKNAVESLEHSMSLFSALNDTTRLPTLLMETGMVHWTVGDIESARKSYQQALKIRQEEKNLFSQAEVLNNLAILYHQIGEYELAAETFEAGLACARKSQNRHAESLILIGFGDLYAEVEEFDASSKAYHQAEFALGGQTGFKTNYLIVARGNLALIQGRLDEVDRILKSFRRKIKISQSAYEQGLWALLEGRYQLSRDKPSKALPFLKESMKFFEQDGRELELQGVAVWLAAAYEQKGDLNEARRVFVELLADDAQPDHSLLVVLRQASPLLSELQKDQILGRQLRGWMEKADKLYFKLPSVRRALRRHSTSIQVPSASLVLRALGNPEVSINNKVIPMSEWRTQSVRDLFFYFLIQKDALTKEQIGAILWPETRDAQALKARFKNEIYRLRRAIGRDVIVFEDEYYRFNNQMDYEYDVEAFDSLLTRARRSIDPLARIRHLQQAVDLMNGPYLADVAGDWVIPERERLNQAYGSTLEQLACLYLDTNQLAYCLSTCQKAMVRDRFHEKIYQVQMQAFAAIGDRSAFVQAYKTCKLAMKELGILPSTETERIYLELNY
jgi:ATP/maltotriose-dependent transcriptional regulator MalT/DNA-binding SARP family transcriptional activator